MLYAYPVVFRQDQNGTTIAMVPDVPGTMTVGGDRKEALLRVHGALVVMLSAMMEDYEPIPRPSRPARSQRVVVLSLMAAAKLSLYQTMRVRRMPPEDLAKRLGWDQPHLRRVLDLRQRCRLEDIDAALGALGKRLVIEVENAA